MTEIANPELAKAMEEALECYGSAPPSEQSTCDWVISPLLLAVGYARRDMVSQVGNGGGGIPDYTVLPGTPYTWYLEAKDWSRSLDRSQEAVQALNYANARGHQWVVLSNGREWRLFDNHIQGIPDAKLVARAEVNDPGFPDFIMALGKSSVQSGGLAEYAATWRLREVLRQQLALQQLLMLQKRQLMLTVHQLQLLNQPVHQCLIQFQILGMEFQYQLCQLKPQATPHPLQLRHQPS